MTTDLESSVDDEIIATLSDYLDGALPADRKAEVEAKLATDADWRRVHGELQETREALSGLQKARAPVTFSEDVTGTIHKMSAGRFFARRTFGDRVPFGALLVVAVLVLAVIGYVMYTSQTGSLKVDPKHESHGSEAMPKP
jgi:anti-sigma factor RsiW